MVVRRDDELYHYGVKGMKWKDHKYVTPEEAEKRRKRAESNKKEQASRERLKDWRATNRKNDAWGATQREYLRKKHENKYDKAVQRKEAKTQDEQRSHRKYKELEDHVNSKLDSQDRNGGFNSTEKHYKNAEDARDHATSKALKEYLNRQVNAERSAKRKTDWINVGTDNRVKSNIKQHQQAEKTGKAKSEMLIKQGKARKEIEQSKQKIAETRKEMEKAAKTQEKIENTKPVKLLKKIGNQIMDTAKTEKGKKKINKILKKFTD